MTGFAEEDFWQLRPARRDADPWAGLNFSIVRGIDPLDPMQRDRFCPDALRAHLFGDDEDMGTFAIVDTARVFGLADELATSVRAARCLFTAEAAENWGDVAPWLVRLTPDDDLTRALFTRGETAQHLWSQAPATFYRSEKSFEDLWRHFRRFTRIRNEAGSWFYFRFWEVSAPFGLALAGPGRAEAILSGIKTSIHLLPQAGAALLLSPHEAARPRLPQCWTTMDLRALGVAHYAVQNLRPDPPAEAEFLAHLSACWQLCADLPQAEADLVRTICEAVHREGAPAVGDILARHDLTSSRVTRKRAISDLKGRNIPRRSRGE